MSNLSEEEIKDVIQDLRYDVMYAKNKIEYTKSEIEKICIAFINCMDLYNKEKEKNKELTETLKCTQNSWYEDTQVIEELRQELNKEKEKNKELEKQLEDKDWDISINRADAMLDWDEFWKDKIKDYFYNKRTYRQFELQQEYKDFEDDVKLNTIDEIEKELLGE